MKTNIILSIAFGALVSLACSDFDDVNTNPQAVNEKDVKPYWALNKSIISDQQNPNDAERVFVLYWADIARQDGENGNRACGMSNDEWAGCLYSLTGNCIKYADLCQNLCDKNATGEHEKAFYPNLKAFAKIWKVYLMTEFVDSFGAMPVEFSEINPEFKSVKDVYDYMFTQIEEAVNAINTGVTPESSEQLCDPAYAYDAAKWKNFGISLWMRIAMRLSNIDGGATARTQFEKAVAAGTGIISTDGTFRVAESTGWDDLSGVMSRSWDWQELSMTMANLMTNLGGVDALELIKDPGHNFYSASPDAAEIDTAYAPYVKDASRYLGVKLKGITKEGEKNMTEINTDSPTIGYFFDGLPSRIDPRSFAYYTLPGDADNPNKVFQGPSFMKTDKETMNITKDTTDISQIGIRLAFNGLPCGYGHDDLFNTWCKFSDGYGTAYPSLSQRYRAGTEYRVFFGPWETYFLKAEAALLGWNTGGMSAEDAYYAGIKANLDYLGLGSFYESYIDSEGYNRVGTSVKFSHTAEPADFDIEVMDAQTGVSSTVTYHYPVASKCLYTEGLNTKLAKIMTQKYIANTPWLPLENWSDHRRTGLPFWEIPLGSTEYNYLDGWTTTCYKNGQKVGYYAQRMNYPSKFGNADPEGYKAAIALMGMDNEKTVTPLWWAKGATVK